VNQRTLFSFAAACCLAASAAAQFPDGRQSTFGLIVGARSGLCLGAATGSGRDGDNVIQAACERGGTRWRLRELGGGDHAIIEEGSGLALDVHRSSRDDGANIRLWSWNGSAAQRWRIEAIDWDEVQIVNVGSGKCAQIEGAPNAAGANIAQYRCSGASSQRWRIERISTGWEPPTAILPPPTRPPLVRPPSGRVVASGLLVSRASGRCADVEGRRGDDVNIRQWRCQGSGGQFWEAVDIGRGEVALLLRGDGHVIDVAPGGFDQGNAVLRPWDGRVTQRWRLETIERGSLRLLNIGSNRCLDVEGGRFDDGANIMVYACHHGANQQWRFESRPGNVQPPIGGIVPPPRPLPDRPPVVEQFAPEAPPAWAVGIFVGSSPMFGGDLEVAIEPNGRVTMQPARGPRWDGYYRSGEIVFGQQRYPIEQTGNGLRMNPPTDRELPIQLRFLRPFGMR